MSCCYQPLQPEVWLFFAAMKAFVQLQKRCFSKRIDSAGYRDELKTFKSACVRLPVVKIPVKMHILVAHLDRALRETSRGLGADSEQGHERAHPEFAQVWNRYRVRDVTNPIYSQHLKSALLAYNTSHVPESVS